MWLPLVHTHTETRQRRPFKAVYCLKREENPGRERTLLKGESGVWVLGAWSELFIIEIIVYPEEMCKKQCNRGTNTHRRDGGGGELFDSEAETALTRAAEIYDSGVKRSKTFTSFIRMLLQTLWKSAKHLVQMQCSCFTVTRSRWSTVKYRLFSVTWPFQRMCRVG